MIMGAHVLCKHEVGVRSSHPPPNNRTLAQLVERLPYTQDVVSSNLAGPTKLYGVFSVVACTLLCESDSTRSILVRHPRLCPDGGMVDTLVLEANVERRESSSLSWGTKF